MNRRISHLHQIQLRPILMAFLVGLTLLLSVAISSFGGAFPAQAAPAQTSAAPVAQDEVQSAPEADSSEGGLLDTIREKLNLDEPLPESTKLFFKQVQGEDVEVEEPRPSGKGNNPMQ